MHLTTHPLLRVLGRGFTFVLLSMAGLAGSAWAQLPAARIMSVTGSAKAIDPQGRERQLEKGAEVRSGEKIVTADGALVQMRLNDGGFMSVRSGTEMVIDRFSYDEKNASNSSFLVSLVRGGFRSITGLIGKTNPDAYQIRTATATVGIRGTDHEPMVIPEGVPGMTAMGAPGFYDKVNDGETFIRNRGAKSDSQVSLPIAHRKCCKEFLTFTKWMSKWTHAKLPALPMAKVMPIARLRTVVGCCAPRCRPGAKHLPPMAHCQRTKSFLRWLRPWCHRPAPQSLRPWRRRPFQPMRL
jgi:hypothetical protein